MKIKNRLLYLPAVTLITFPLVSTNCKNNSISEEQKQITAEIEKINLTVENKEKKFVRNAQINWFKATNYDDSKYQAIVDMLNVVSETVIKVRVSLYLSSNKDVYATREFVIEDFKKFIFDSNIVKELDDELESITDLIVLDKNKYPKDVTDAEIKTNPQLANNHELVIISKKSFGDKLIVEFKVKDVTSDNESSKSKILEIAGFKNETLEDLKKELSEISELYVLDKNKYSDEVTVEDIKVRPELAKKHKLQIINKIPSRTALIVRFTIKDEITNIVSTEDKTLVIKDFKDFWVRDFDKKVDEITSLDVDNKANKLAKDVQDSEIKTNVTLSLQQSLKVLSKKVDGTKLIVTFKIVFESPDPDDQPSAESTKSKTLTIEGFKEE